MKDLVNKYKVVISLFLLVVVYSVGIIGIYLPQWKETVLPLTPINLLFTLIILLWNEENWNWKLIIWMCLVGSLGFVFEALGTQTGLIFGEYSYLETLGIKWQETPLIMFVNWLFLVYASVAVLNNFKLPTFIKALVVGCILAGLDFLIEPIAIKLNFWTWHGKPIPAQNYLAWFALATIFSGLFFINKWRIKNKLAIYVLIIQVVFFSMLNLLL